MCNVAVDSESDHSTCTHYQLPDHQQLVVDNTTLQQCPEAMFKPSLIDKEFEGIPKLCYNAILSNDVDLHRDLFRDIVLTGGNTMFPGFCERFDHEIRTLCEGQGYEAKVIKGCKDGAWLGGSILASHRRRVSSWVTKEQYEEHGPQIMNDWYH